MPQKPSVFQSDTASRRYVRLFCENVRTVRRALNKQQDVLADRAGLSRQQWSNIERGHGIPNLETMTKIADAMQVELLDLLR